MKTSARVLKMKEKVKWFGNTRGFEVLNVQNM